MKNFKETVKGDRSLRIYITIIWILTLFVSFIGFVIPFLKDIDKIHSVKDIAATLTENLLLPLLAISAGVILTGVLIIRHESFKLKEAANRLDEGVGRLSQTEQELKQTLENLQITSHIIATQHEFLQVIEKLKYDPDLADFVGRQFTKLAVQWGDLFFNLKMVGNTGAPDREFWKKILSLYIEEEIADIKDQKIATNIDLYAKLLELFMDENALPTQGTLCLLFINSVLPEQWFNWPHPREVGKAYAPEWLIRYRLKLNKLVNKIRNGQVRVKLKRITLVLDKGILTRTSLKSVDELQQQVRKSLVPSSSFDETFSVGELSELLQRVSLGPPPYVPQDKDAKVYFIGQFDRSPISQGETINLLRKFIEELHPSDDDAFYRILIKGEVDEIERGGVPIDYILISNQQSNHDLDPVFAIAAYDLDPEKSTLLVRLYGKKDIQQLAEWAQHLRRNARYLSDLLKS